MAEDQETEDSKKIGAKVLSKIAMILAGIWIFVMNILKGLGKINLSESDIIVSGASVVAVWTPTYLSIILDKIKEMKVS